MPDQICPNCGLINPESALRCDCGYDFPSQKIKKSYLSREEQEKLKDHRKIDLVGLVKIVSKLGMGGGLITMAIAIVWLIVGLGIGLIFFYPIFLFLIGLLAFFVALYISIIRGATHHYVLAGTVMVLLAIVSFVFMYSYIPAYIPGYIFHAIVFLIGTYLFLKGLFTRKVSGKKED